MEEVEFFKVEVVDLKEVPGEEEMEEAGVCLLRGAPMAY